MSGRDVTSSNRLVRLVLTGGPGAGKTVIADALSDADHLADWRESIGGLTLVPEAATQVYTARCARWDRLDRAARGDIQTAIYHFQREQEDRMAALAYERGHRLLLLDRGTLDGAAYWPDGPAHYWQTLGTNPQDELARYDGVILLETAAALGSHLYDGETSNAVRFETPDAAIESGRLLESLWGDHPHLRRIAATPDFEEKIAAVAREVSNLLEHVLPSA